MIHKLNFNDFDEINRIKKFLEDNRNDYMQGIEWNIVRNEDKKYFLYYVENNEIIWTCSLLEKQKNDEKFLYAPRGPVLKKQDFLYINNFLENIKKWMNNNNYNKLIINPYLNKYELDKISNVYSYSIAESNDYKNQMESSKLAIMNIIFDEEQLLNKLSSKHRQNTRRSYRKNLTFKVSKNVDIVNFYDLYLQTAKRHSFIPHTIEYFKKIIDIYKNELVFFEVWYGNNPLAMSIDIKNNEKLIYLYGVSSSENRNLLGMYNLQWETIRYCIKNRIPKYDFGGVFCGDGDMENKDYGLYTFKKGYCYDGFIDVIPDITFVFGGD